MKFQPKYVDVIVAQKEVPEVIKYKSGYKYQLTEGVMYSTFRAWGFHDAAKETRFLTLQPDGLLVIRAGYAWDGPSGPTIDTKNFMRGSLVHDALYQLIRQGHIAAHFRDQADVVLKEICLEDGMWPIRAWWVYTALHWFGDAAADPDNVKVVHTAP